MTDFSYQKLISALAPQVQSPTPLMDGLSGAAPSTDLLAMMRAKQAQQQDPRMVSREIDPGPTWGGKDRNLLTPGDVMQSRFYTQPPEPI